MNQRPTNVQLDDLRTAIHQLGLAYELLDSDLLNGGENTTLAVFGRAAGPWEIAVDEACGVFRWVSGPDAGHQVGLISDPAMAAWSVAWAFGIETPKPRRREPR